MATFAEELEQFVASVGCCPAGVVIHPVPLSLFSCGNTHPSEHKTDRGHTESVDTEACGNAHPSEHKTDRDHTESVDTEACGNTHPSEHKTDRGHTEPVDTEACGNAFDSVDEAAASLLRIRADYLAAGSREVIFVYEDLWRNRPELVRRRLRSHFQAGESIFARNCDVREISQETAAAFLERNHIYGSTKSKYRYGLFRRRATGAGEAGMPDTPTMVAVGTFSEHNEWERYASLPQVRVCGGMGKILKHFISTAHPTEVMSYADLEWGDGSVYETLGFRNMKCTPPVHFLINPDTFERIHLQKFERDKRYTGICHEGWPEIANPGSKCMLLDIEKL